jgi:8-oxo-dGTP pyrophosphatase MutT (NUDIX family)
VARLASLPADLPAPPEALLPVRIDTGERRRPAMPTGPGSARVAAVLVLITPDSAAEDPEAEVVLIERVDRGGHHSGEISFPGGKAEGGETIEATALREAFEEVGLDATRDGVRLLGRLEPFWIPVSDYQVHPVLATADRRPTLTASPDEVASILRAPLDAFLPGSEIVVVEQTVRGWALRYGAYPIAGHQVWGATARVLGQLGAILGGPAAAATSR